MQIRLLHVSLAKLLVAFIAAATLLVPFNSSAEVASEQGKFGAQPYVILLRHAQAPGRGEPENFNLNDCSTQRSLSDRGRDEARELGNSLRSLGVHVTKVVASRWCRARQTAQLLNLGPVEDNRVFDNLEVNKNRSQFLLESERRLIASWRGPGVLVVVTHSSNLSALAEVTPEPGSIIVVEPSNSVDWIRAGQVNLREPPDLMLY
jgi:phosphohistidine phosphatase SixA